jgi:hypothetical protein
MSRSVAGSYDNEGVKNQFFKKKIIFSKFKLFYFKLYKIIFNFLFTKLIFPLFKFNKLEFKKFKKCYLKKKKNFIFPK